jgi:hypothetical protein
MSTMPETIMSAQLFLRDALKQTTQNILFAGGAGGMAQGAGRALATHRFQVCSADTVTEVRVLHTGGDGGRVSAVLRPVTAASRLESSPLLQRSGPRPRRPGQRLVGRNQVRQGVLALKPAAGGILCTKPGTAALALGLWELEIQWERRGGPDGDKALTWVYQVWGQSCLQLDMDVKQFIEPGDAIDVRAEAHGLKVTDVRCEVSVSRPTANLDNELAPRHKDIIKELQALLDKHWPDDPKRPWWRLDPAHKLQALAMANAPIPRLRGPREPLHGAPDPGDVRRTHARLVGTKTTVPGCYHVLVRMTGRVGPGPAGIFERIVYRQVFAIPRPHKAVVTSKLGAPRRPILTMSFRDKLGNYAFIDAGHPIDIQLTNVRGTSIGYDLEYLSDGSVNLRVSRDVLGDSVLRVGGSWDGRERLEPRDVPLPQGMRADLHPTLSRDRLTLPLLRQTVDPTDRSTLVLRRSESVALRRPPADLGQFFDVFAASAVDSPWYLVEVLHEGVVRHTIEGQGTQRFLLPDDLPVGSEVRVRARGDRDELELLGLNWA